MEVQKLFVFKLLLASGGMAASFLFGGWTHAMSTLIIFVVVDIITGWLASRHEGKLSSKVGFIGIASKFIMFALVSVAYHMDQHLGTGSLLRDGTVAFYIANEALSIIENAGRMGVPIPSKIKEAIEVLKGKEKEKE